MASLNPITRELVFKVVFCGPGLCGKTTTLERLHERAPPEARGQLVSLATDSDRTLYFDFLPLRLPRVRGLHIRLQLFTVPGQVHYAATRKLVLTGSDAIVFVADAQNARAEANAESLEDLETSLLDLGRSLAAMPHVMQWNKVDLDDLTPDESLEASLNRHKAPSFRTVATRGDGVSEVLDAISRLTIDSYWAAMPLAPQANTQRIHLRPEEAGIASALREWTEGKSVAPSGEVAPTERDLDGLPPLSPRKSSSLVPPTARAASARSSRPPAPSAEWPPARTGHPSSPPLPASSNAVPATANGTTDRRSSSGPAFSLAELFGEEERTDVRGIEELVARGDTRGAVLACDVIVGRALARLAHDRGTAWLLAGLDAGHYRAFRSIVETAQKGENVDQDAALRCVVWAATAALAAR